MEKKTEALADGELAAMTIRLSEPKDGNVLVAFDVAARIPLIDEVKSLEFGPYPVPYAAAEQGAVGLVSILPGKAGKVAAVGIAFLKSILPLHM